VAQEVLVRDIFVMEEGHESSYKNVMKSPKYMEAFSG
jgi:hypothetical protein